MNIIYLMLRHCIKPVFLDIKRVEWCICFWPSWFQGCARDLLTRDQNKIRNPCLRNRNETEMFKILSETRPKRDAAASETLAETLKLPRLSKVSRLDQLINQLGLNQLINSHHDKRFLFVIL